MFSDAPTHSVVCDDGARIGLFRIQGGQTPVLLIHGTFSTHSTCANLGRFLAERGHDVWMFDWRGHGASQAPSSHYTFDDVALMDFGAVLAFVRAETADRSISLIGHSGGGLISAMWMARFPHLANECVHSNVMIASQATEAAKCTDSHRKIKEIALWLSGRDIAPAGSLGVGDEAESARLMQQWCDWNLSGSFHGSDGFDYAASLAKVEVPTLAISAVGDTFVAPPSGCQSLLDAFAYHSNRHLLCGKATGFDEDFNHSRILNSSTARAEILPHIVDWVSQDGS